MIRKVLVCIFFASPALANGSTVEKLQSCFNSVDQAFRAAAGDPIETRLHDLQGYGLRESQCISDALSGCVLSISSERCAEGMASWLESEMYRLQGQMPEEIAGSASLQDRYNRWLVRVREGKAIRRGGCDLTDGFPPDSCEILAVGTGLIDARGWDRTLREIERSN